MAKKKHRKKKKTNSIVSNLLFCLAVIILVGCLGGLYYHHRLTKQKKQQLREEAIAREQMNITSWELEPVQTEDEEVLTDAIQGLEEQERIKREEEEEAARMAEELAKLTPEPTEEPVDVHDATILVLNGTGVPGVAAYWQNQLFEKGFKDVAIASYNLPVQQDTRIFSMNLDYTEAFGDLYPTAVLQRGNITQGITVSAGIVLPEHIDVFILVGRKDARNK